MVEKSLAENPAAQENLDKLEAFTQSWLAQNPEATRQNNEYIIPLVIHAFHNYTSGSFVTKDHILDAVRILNRDIKALNPDTADIDSVFKPSIGHLNIRFELARLDPHGDCTDGITRTATPLVSDGDERLKDLISWDTQKYMNIWLCSSLSFNAGGYAFYPGTAPAPHREGIVCITSQFGSLPPSINSNLAHRTITHEVGHYLNLRHTWGNSNSSGTATNCAIDDLVDDTPLTRGNSGGCPLNTNSCVDTSFFSYDIKDNIQNYMDYAPCESMFTRGQADRMEAALHDSAGFRNLLWQPSNLYATGVHDSSNVGPCGMKADARPEKKVTCVGSSVRLIDYSWNGTAISRAWTVHGPGFSMINSTDSIGEVLLTAPGYYDIELEVVSRGNVSSSYRLNSAIYVYSDVPSIVNPVSEGFQAGIPSDYHLESDGDHWTINSNVGYNSTASIWHENDGLEDTEIASFYLPSLSVKSWSQPEITFDYAYARKDSNSFEELRVWVSKDCGNSWIPRKTIGTTDLITSVNHPLDFIPNGSEWKSASIPLGSYRNADQILVRFDFMHGNGNSIYVDNINLQGKSVGLEEGNQISGLSLFPNPAANELKLSFELFSREDLNLEVYSSLGKQMMQQSMPGMKEGEHQIDLDINGWPAGVYFVKLISPKGERVQRLVKQ